MYSLLIVDDEKVVLDALKTIMNWSEYGVSDVNTVSDGIEALEFIKDSPPDIVLTDIRMPGLNGLELVEQSKSYTNQTMFIMISGHTEFAYAKKAIELEAVDYLVKPIEMDDIAEAIKKAIEKYKKKSEQNNVERYLDELEDKYLLESIVGGRIDTQWINRHFNIYQVAVISVKEATLHENLKKNEQKYLTLFKEPLMSKGYSVFMHVIEEQIVMVYGNTKTASMEEGLADQVTSTIQRELGVITTTGVSGCFNNMKDMHNAYQRAKRAYDIGFFYNQGYTDYSTLPNHEKSIDYRMIFEIEDFSQQISKFEEYYHLADTILNYIYAEELSPEKSKYLYYKFLNSLNTYLEKEYNVKNKDLVHADLLLYEEAKGFNSLASIQKWIYTYTKQWENYIENHRISYNDNLVREVRKYLDEHFHEEIELNRLAEMYHINSSYLSSLFSKKMDMTLFDYLTSLRLKNAKVLLKTTNYKVNEICQKVGYENSRYFNQVFKKKVGTTPGKYRSKHLIRVNE
ncbi:response regulator [Halobacillus mangrovi]|uniref:response regulator n=1 Tax=Halobacillus mangrovi TaxID=402384 RepID=UPI003D962DC9